ncbi:hypothetical protein B0H17DRAFT_1192291 [Mycena rosella]|uniref:F-box domain-containing protein n=1 Tax=Mycena rosella TaxID=1033263 RepID=A0AAD7GWH5_MYCRO|nr:hypothetical protein B0H17DRAFT_1192291 [Mycena rosella]
MDPTVSNCCRTLNENLKLALLVRKFDVFYWQIDSPTFDVDFADLFSDTFSNLKNLEKLTFGCGRQKPDYFDVIAPQTFPNLRYLHVHVRSHAAQLVECFLQVHPHLLTLNLPWRAPADVASSFTRVKLPALRRLSTNATVFPLLVRAHPALKSTEVRWKKTRKPLAPPIAALHASSCESLRHLVCSGPRANVDLIQLVAAQLPALTVLRVLASAPAGPLHNEATVQVIAAVLAQLPKLRVFEYRYTLGHEYTLEDGYIPSADRRAVRAMVTAWGQACPTLKRCDLNGVTWKRPTTGKWRPMEM